MKRIILFMFLLAIVALVIAQVYAKDLEDKTQLCPPGEVVRGIDDKGTIICTTDCTTNQDGDAVSDCVDTCIDADSDLYGEGIDCLGSDCDDQNSNINPGAPEICNGIDDNCNYVVDQAEVPVSVMCPAGPNVALVDCQGTLGCVNEICDPGYFDNDGVFENGCESTCDPWAPEICNGIDDNCNHVVDQAEVPVSVMCGSVPNAIEDCAGANGCVITDCDPGYCDNDGIYENGCEVSC